MKGFKHVIYYLPTNLSLWANKFSLMTASVSSFAVDLQEGFVDDARQINS